VKPFIQRELDAIKKMVVDLENRLRNEREELGYRTIFGIGRRGDVPAPKASDRGRVLGVDGWFTVTGSGGGGGGLSTVEVDNVTISGNGTANSPLSATLLSATLDARVKNLSGSVDGRFNSLSYLSAVSHNSTLSGDGTVGNPLSAAPTFVAAQTAITASINNLSGTINATLLTWMSSSQAWSQIANGTEGNILTAFLPFPFAGPQYYVFVTNTTGSSSSVYRIQNKGAASFQVVSTAPFVSGERLDFLAISGGLGPVLGNFPSVPTGTLQISVAGSNPSEKNVSQEGNIDWIVPISSARPKAYSAGNLWAKATGGWLADSLEPVHGGVGTTLATFSSQNPPITADSGDTIGNAVISSNLGSRMFMSTTSPGHLNWGFMFRVPADTDTRVVRIYTGQYACRLDVSASLSDRSAPMVVAQDEQPTGTSARRTWTIVYNSSKPAELIVRMRVSKNNASDSANVGIVAITVSGNL
jgi:hypothetical protein